MCALFWFPGVVKVRGEGQKSTGLPDLWGEHADVSISIWLMNSFQFEKPMKYHSCHNTSTNTDYGTRLVFTAVLRQIGLDCPN